MLVHYYKYFVRSNDAALKSACAVLMY